MFDCELLTNVVEIMDTMIDKVSSLKQKINHDPSLDQKHTVR